MSTDVPIRYRWFQFSLRTLLTLTLVISLLTGWVMKERRRIAARQAHLSMQFNAIGKVFDALQPEFNKFIFGEDTFSYAHSFTASLDPPRIPPGATASSASSRIPSDIQNEDCALLLELERVTFVDLSQSNVDDECFRYLRKLKCLRVLRLGGSRVTGTGLVHLAELPSLSGLDLANTQVTDLQLAYLNRLANLESLNLDNTQITNVGLEQLKGLTKLNRLRVGKSNVTGEGIKQLQAALPNCTILSDPGHK